MIDPDALPDVPATDLDGHTLDELEAYLEAGRSPRNESIERSPGCQLALESLERLRRLTADMVREDEEDAATDDSWVNWILSGIALDAHAGRRIPYRDADPHDLGVTEGAVRGLVRHAEESLPGVVIGRCRLEGDVETPDAPTRIVVEVCMPFGPPIPELADQLRARILEDVATHTDLNVSAVDIVVTDVSTERHDGGA
ncbi:Asp23/Gls24 family envelope stress response protein [Arachnia propionica]|uniref:Asp23/Gls24 family envelope stress response protein n=1 Tax=Arachnia propionica TaxID=1750 RepID=A0A3P1WS01_9ACTN|nr:Asp23/Gls24 family envelope stress response protein [Arachnia propionica]RRD49075.1 Asp23/Gls24 family envelope stress response protein [Arachnia propionica]